MSSKFNFLDYGRLSEWDTVPDFNSNLGFGWYIPGAPEERNVHVLARASVPCTVIVSRPRVIDGYPVEDAVFNAGANKWQWIDEESGEILVEDYSDGSILLQFDGVAEIRYTVDTQSIFNILPVDPSSPLLPSGVGVKFVGDAPVAAPSEEESYTSVVPGQGQSTDLERMMRLLALNEARREAQYNEAMAAFRDPVTGLPPVEVVDDDAPVVEATEPTP
ncbi:hypothetical protein [Tortoise microvirus 46]|nr:hypothetical protein [Tortoise microvirus 46]